MQCYVFYQHLSVTPSVISSGQWVLCISKDLLTRQKPALLPMCFCGPNICYEHSRYVVWPGSELSPVWKQWLLDSLTAWRIFVTAQTDIYLSYWINSEVTWLLIGQAKCLSAALDQWDKTVTAHTGRCASHDSQSGIAFHNQSLVHYDN